MLVLAVVWIQASVVAADGQRLTLRDATGVAMQRNPELAEAAAEVRATAAGANVAGALPEPMLSYQAWQQPLSRPFDPSATNMHMIGIRQSLPFPGQRRLTGRAAGEAASASRQDLRARRLAVQAQVTHAYIAWWRAGEELAIHLDHMAVAERTLAAVQSRYATGGARQAEILRAETELHRLHADIAGIRAGQRAARALLNSAMGSAADAALLPPEPPDERVPAVAVGERPEIEAARLRAESLATAARAAERARRAPDLMVGFDYMLMPGFPDAYSVMLQVGVPWFSSRRRGEAERATAEAQRARGSAATAELAARYEVVESRARADAAKARLDMLTREVVPRAENTLASMQGAYGAGGADLVALLDAENVLLYARLSAMRERVALGDAAADLRRALGIDVLEEGKP
jgi:cobalt-zinc-cadmium efflux system outer membrane protein